MPADIADGESGLSARTKINEGFSDIKHNGPDNSILRANGTDSALQSSGILIDDSDNMSGVNILQVNAIFGVTAEHLALNGNANVKVFVQSLVTDRGLWAFSAAFSDDDNNTASVGALVSVGFNGIPNFVINTADTGGGGGDLTFNITSRTVRVNSSSTKDVQTTFTKIA